MAETIGFIGVGHIAGAIIEALQSMPQETERIVLSPRSVERSQALAQRYPAVTVAASNQAVLDQSDTVFLCVRPQNAQEILAPLTFAERHLIVSLIAAPMEAVEPLVRPAESIIRLLVLPTCTRRSTAVPYWPGREDLKPLLRRLGPPLPVATEDDMTVIWATTAIIASFLGLLDTVSDWAVQRGVDSVTATDYVASMTHSLTEQVLEGDAQRFGRLAVEVATPGGLNEQVIETLRSRGVFEQVREALQQILLRISPTNP